MPPLFWRHGDAERDFEFTDVLPRLSRHALGFIRDHQKSHSGQPFFLYYPLTAPHLPYVPVEEFGGTSQAGTYGDFVHQVDYHVGEISDLLDSLDIRRNTLFIVTSDNGSRWHPEDIEKYEHRANYHFRGMKTDVWEGGHRVAFLVRWPDMIEAGSSSDKLVCHNDLIATCAELTGQTLDWNAGEDSYSFLSALTGEESDREERHIIINQSLSTVFSIRKDNWKLIPDMSSGGWSSQEITDGPPMQLYNLSEDVQEQNNLYESMPEKVKELQSLLEMCMLEGRSRFQ